MDAELVGMSFSIAENEAFYVPVPADQEEALKIVNEFRPVFENENSLKVGQNIKYDMIVLQNYGVQVKGPLFDTDNPYWWTDWPEREEPEKYARPRPERRLPLRLRRCGRNPETEKRSGKGIKGEWRRAAVLWYRNAACSGTG